MFGMGHGRNHPDTSRRAGLNAVCGLAEKLRRLRLPDQVIDASLEVALALTGTRRAAVVLRDPESKTLRIAKYRDEANAGGGDFQISLTVVQETISGNESLLVRNALLDDRFKNGDSIIAGGIQSILCVPLGDERQAFGAIYADTTSNTGALNEEQLFLLSAIAHQAGVALERAWLVADLQKLFVGAMHSMVRSLEARDAYTRGHTGRVMLLALQLADSVGIDPEEREALELGGLMHDIGKIGIRDSILSKPGRLTSEEFELVKSHPAIGAEILGGMPNLERLVSLVAVIEAVRGHHERFDGHGYPDGLAGTQIPCSARFLAIADVWDALTTTRSYREAMSTVDAWNIMESGSGTQFDPDMLAVFKELVVSGAVKDLSGIPTSFGLENTAPEFQGQERITPK
jgi:HD-GYP domain-containing protein (c-di-GMP phosphodiesterase class II)